jgi:hypothetical protein
MNESSKTYWTDDPEQVERYVLGLISEEEKARLDAEIADCAQCREQLHREMQIAAGIRLQGRNALKSRLRSKIRKEGHSKGNRFQVIGLVAAVIIIALAVGIYQIWFIELKTPEKFGSSEIVIQLPEAENTEISGPDRTVADAREEKSEENRIASAPVTAEERLKSNGRAQKDRTAEKARQDISAGSSASSPAAASPQSTPILQVGKSIWLLGTIEMIPDEKRDVAAASESKMSMEKSGRRSVEQRSKRIIVQRRNGAEEVVLQHRSFGDLPRSRQTQMGKTNRIETLIEQNTTGLNVTIFSDIFSPGEIEHAIVETPSDDSLIITTTTQRIVYRLPAEALYQQRTRR